MTPQDGNALRADIQSAKDQIPKLNLERAEKRVLAFGANQAYCEASCATGEAWNQAENKTKEGRPKTVEISTVVSAEDAGFLDRKDAQICGRIAELNKQDRDVYYDACRLENKMPTINGLHETLNSR